MVHKLTVFAGVTALMFAVPSAQADLHLVGPTQLGGQGFGNTLPILTLHDTEPPRTADNIESGDVTPSGIDTILGHNDTEKTVNKTSLRSFADLGVTSASDLRIVFNGDEPGQSKSSIDLGSLDLTIYNGTTAVFTASLDHPYHFDSTFPGVGNSGFAFALTDAQALAAQPFVTAQNTVGLSASLTNFEGGPETFSGASVNAVPEPGSIAMILAGLAGVAGVVRRRLRG